LKGQIILSDFAEEHDGKLYVMGGGWNRISARAPANMSLAILLYLDRSELNQSHKMAVALLKGTGDQVLDTSSQPFRIEGQIQLGPRPEIDPAEASIFTAPIGIRVPTQKLEVGHYVWELRVEDQLLDTATFDAIEGAP
jgi:hypothetical protein